MKKRLLILSLCLCALLSACRVQAPAKPDAAAAEPTAATVAATEPPTEPLTQAPTESPTEPPTPEEFAEEYLTKALSGKLVHSATALEIEEIIQYPELPAGCEVVALTMAMNCFGCDLDKTTVARDYLVYGDNVVTSYVGDPFAYGGAYIYPPGVVKTVKRFNKKEGAALYPRETTGSSLSDLYKLIDAGCPVLVWTTVYLNYPDFEGSEEYKGFSYPYYGNEHCVTLYGYDTNAGTVSIADPQRGKITVGADEFEEIYNLIGKISMTLIDAASLPS